MIIWNLTWERRHKRIHHESDKVALESVPLVRKDGAVFSRKADVWVHSQSLIIKALLHIDVKLNS